VGSGEAAQLGTILVSGVAGLMVGSFLNVVVYRLPRQMSVVQPPSHCPSCDTRLTLVDLVPVLSWLWLRARCRHCGARISGRYPLVELSAGVLCAAAAGALGSVWPLPSVAVVLLCALAASIVDADGGHVPVAFAVVAAFAAISLLPIAAALGHADRLIWAAVGALLGFLGAFIGDRADESQRWARIALLACLAWTAGWLWPGGGAFVAAWIVVATAAAGLGATKRAPFAMLAAGSVVAVLASALISRP
jgi:leader peptidase (prepilin peptidase) / N-methyltransferase